MLEQYKKFIVTGGCGFVGRRLVASLHSRNKEVLIIDNLSTCSEKTIPTSTELSVMDICDQRIAEVISSADVVFHLAGNSNGTLSVENPEFDFFVNAKGTQNVLDAAHSCKVKKFVYVSSAAVYGKPVAVPIPETHPTNPLIPYGNSKLQGEYFCCYYYKEYGFPVVIVRPFCIYGSGDNPKTFLVEVNRYVRWHLNNLPIQIIGDRDLKTRDFVHVDDVISGLILLAESGVPGGIYNMGSGEEFSMANLVFLIGTITKREPEVLDLPEVTDDSYRLVPDISVIKALGFRPHVRLEDGLRELIARLGPNTEPPSGATIFRKQQKGKAEQPISNSHMLSIERKNKK